MERPFVFVNLAMSADGKLSTRERRQVKISGPADFERVDVLKAGADAILVGIGTVLADDPSLTVKSAERKEARKSQGLSENPVRIVIDSNARTPPDADILHKGPGRRIIAVAAGAPKERLDALCPFADIIVTGKKRVDLPELFARLKSEGIATLMVEGGGTVIWSLFRDGLVDECYTCIGPIIIGGANAPTPADGEGFLQEDSFPRLRCIGMESVDDAVLLRWQVLPKPDMTEES